jgi:hypothetical protein
MEHHRQLIYQAQDTEPKSLLSQRNTRLREASSHHQVFMEHELHEYLYT